MSTKVLSSTTVFKSKNKKCFLSISENSALSPEKYFEFEIEFETYYYIKYNYIILNISFYILIILQYYCFTMFLIK